MKTNRRISLLALVAAMVSISVAQPRQISAQTTSTAEWSIRVDRVDPGDIDLSSSFQIAIYENLLHELSKTKRFKQVLRDGDRNATAVSDLLILTTTVQKYTAGSETRRAVTTLSGATKLTVLSQLRTRDGKIILERTMKGNVHFFGSNLRATHNLARNVAKAITQSSLPEPSVSTPAAGAQESTAVLVRPDAVLVEILP